MKTVFCKPQVDLNVTVTADWTDYFRPWNKNLRRSSVYNGVVVASAKYDDPQSFRMATGDRDYPIRIISLDAVTSLTFSDGSSAKVSEKKKIEVLSWNIKSDSKKGGTYTVTREGNHFSCTCIGFGFRKSCKHVLQVKSKVA